MDADKIIDLGNERDDLKSKLVAAEITINALHGEVLNCHLMLIAMARRYHDNQIVFSDLEMTSPTLEDYKLGVIRNDELQHSILKAFKISDLETV